MIMVALGFRFPSDPNVPIYRAGLNVLPAEGAWVPFVEAVEQPHRIVVVDDLHRLAGLQLFETMEDEGMALRSGQDANVDDGVVVLNGHGAFL